MNLTTIQLRTQERADKTLSFGCIIFDNGKYSIFKQRYPIGSKVETREYHNKQAVPIVKYNQISAIIELNGELRKANIVWLKGYEECLKEAGELLNAVN